MKVVAVTMGKSLEVFLGLYYLLEEELGLASPIIFVADSYYFKKIENRHDVLGKATLLKEWELTQKGKVAEPNIGRIRDYELRLADPTFWNALLADRRIFFGKLCKSKQDYKPRFSYKELLGILDTFLVEIDRLFAESQPDLILGFGTATLGDYLFYLFSKEKRVPYLQLKSTKINNYVSLNDTAVGISEHIRARFHSTSLGEESIAREAQRFLDSIPAKGVKYEGAIISGRKRIRGKLVSSPIDLAKALVGSWRVWKDPVTRRDNHLPPPFVSSVHKSVVQPLRAWILDKSVSFLAYEEFEEVKPFLFYPLHFEPEVSLQVFGKPFQNQIEVVRNLALNVPVGMTVLVKEHPRSLGFRKKSYYQKLLDIPNVMLVDPFLPAVQVVRESEAVAVVSGTIGFEAAVCKKPVIVLGITPYELLPNTMVRRVRALDKIGEELRSLMETYRYERSALERYVEAVISESVPIDLYTVLFKKSGRYSQERDETTEEEKRAVDYKRLADYFKKRIHASKAISQSHDHDHPGKSNIKNI